MVVKENIETLLKISRAATIDITVAVPHDSDGLASMFLDGVSNRDCIGLGRRDELVGMHRLLAWIVLVSRRYECWISLDLRIYAELQYLCTLYPRAAGRGE